MVRFRCCLRPLPPLLLASQSPIPRLCCQSRVPACVFLTESSMPLWRVVLSAPRTFVFLPFECKANLQWSLYGYILSIHKRNPFMFVWILIRGYEKWMHVCSCTYRHTPNTHTHCEAKQVTEQKTTRPDKKQWTVSLRLAHLQPLHSLSLYPNTRKTTLFVTCQRAPLKVLFSCSKMSRAGNSSEEIFSQTLKMKQRGTEYLSARCALSASCQQHTAN